VLDFNGVTYSPGGDQQDQIELQIATAGEERRGQQCRVAFGGGSQKDHRVAVPENEMGEHARPPYGGFLTIADERKRSMAVSRGFPKSSADQSLDFVC
jgi:hypothetical protein